MTVRFRQVLALTWVAMHLLAGPSWVDADVLLSIDVIEALPGESAHIGVFAYTDSANQISGFNLPIDFGNDGDRLPVGFSLNAQPIQNSLFANFDLNTALNGIWDIDGIANADGAAHDVSADENDPTRLFDFVVDVGSEVVDGTQVSIILLETVVLDIAGAKLAEPFDVSGSLIVAGGMALAGDCNGDSVVDASDLQCDCSTGTLATVLLALGTLPGDFNGDGLVGFDDFLTLSGNFGNAVGTYSAGDADCDGMVAFSDFLELSRNFGSTSKASLTSVPEPAGRFFLVFGFFPVILSRHCANIRRQSLRAE